MSNIEEKRITQPVRLPKKGVGGEKSVLVVDDEPALCRALNRVLSGKGYEVVTASSAKVAVELITQRQFGVILTDIMMPEMTGVDLLRIIRAYDLDVPVILMTGNPTVETATEAITLGALQYLSKPVANDALIEAVERASRLHQLARAKREALVLAGEAESQAGDLAGLETSLERALDSMWMAFQPIVDVKRKRIFGYEALMRTREPSLPHPGAVLAAAERLDKLGAVGARTRDLSAAAFANAPENVLLFVNLHTRDLLDGSLYEERAPLSRIAGRVVLEITERATLDHVQDVQARVAVLRYNGFKLAIDDLGAGYAGLSSFVALEPDVVKLDMSLVRNSHMSPLRERIIGSMASLCQELGIQVVAEGVEVAEEGHTVRQAGCDLLQGYYFAKPGPPFPEVTF